MRRRGRCPTLRGPVASPAQMKPKRVCVCVCVFVCVCVRACVRACASSKPTCAGVKAQRRKCTCAAPRYQPRRPFPGPRSIPLPFPPITVTMSDARPVTRPAHGLGAVDARAGGVGAGPASPGAKSRRDSRLPMDRHAPTVKLATGG